MTLSMATVQCSNTGAFSEWESESPLREPLCFVTSECGSWWKWVPITLQRMEKRRVLIRFTVFTASSKTACCSLDILVVKVWLDTVFTEPTYINWIHKYSIDLYHEKYPHTDTSTSISQISHIYSTYTPQPLWRSVWECYSKEDKAPAEMCWFPGKGSVSVARW